MAGLLPGRTGALRALALLPAVPILLAGCAPQYPSETYFEAPGKWDNVVRYWQRRYKNAYIEIPKLPDADEYISPKLLGRKNLRVAVVGVIRKQSTPPSGTLSDPSLGSGAIKRWSQYKWGRKTMQGGRVIDCRQELAESLERDLANHARVTIVDRSALKVVFDERKLRLAFSSPSEVRRLGRMEAADAIVIAKAAELEYTVYSVTPMTVDGRQTEHLQWGRAREGSVAVRMIDVSNGTLLWSASVYMGPQHILLAPSIVHREAYDNEPDALTGGAWGGTIAAGYYLVRRLAWRISGNRGHLPNEARVLRKSHRERKWVAPK